MYGSSFRVSKILVEWQVYLDIIIGLYGYDHKFLSFADVTINRLHLSQSGTGNVLLRTSLHRVLKTDVIEYPDFCDRVVGTRPLSVPPNFTEISMYKL